MKESTINQLQRDFNKLERAIVQLLSILDNDDYTQDMASKVEDELEEFGLSLDDFLLELEYENKG
jgi:hypothetical protein